MKRSRSLPKSNPSDVLPAASWVDVRTLEPWPENPWDHPPEQVAQLRASIARHGWGDAITVQASTMRLISGHGRVQAALAELDVDDAWRLADAPMPGQVPARVLELDDDQAAELALAANMGGAVLLEDRMRGVLARLYRTEADFRERATGYTAEAVRALIRPPPKVVPDRRQVEEPGDPSAIEVPLVACSVLGEVYRLGPHLLYCGDSLQPAALAALLDEGEQADAVITDPPFAIFGSSTGVSSSVSDDAMVVPFFRDVLRQVQHSVKRFGHAYVFCDWRSYPAIAGCVKGTHLQASNLLVWDKLHAGLGSKWQNTHELIVFLEHLPAQKTMRGKEVGHRLVRGRSNIVRHARARGSEREHNAAKPVPLVIELIEASTEEGETVIDLFGGSGTTLIAAARSGRRALLSEISPGYCDLIRRRWTRWALAASVDPGPGALAEPS